MNREERVLNVIRRKPVDYLPSQVTLADRSRDEVVAKNLGLAGASELDAFLDNHIFISLTLADTPLFYRNDALKIEELESLGYLKVDHKNKVIYDSWGVGIQIGEDGFFACYHPLEGNKKLNDLAEPFLPDDFDRAILDLPFPEAVQRYHAPDPLKKGNFSDMERHLKEYSGNLLVIPSGYLGIYERTYSIMGFEQFMIESLANTKSVELLMDVVTNRAMVNSCV